MGTTAFYTMFPRKKKQILLPQLSETKRLKCLHVTKGGGAACLYKNQI
jgi:hypothetical protein